VRRPIRRAKISHNEETAPIVDAQVALRSGESSVELHAKGPAMEARRLRERGRALRAQDQTSRVVDRLGRSD